MVRPRIPTSRQLAEGDKSKLGKHRLAAKLASEPRAEHGLPPAPEHLPERVRDCYEFWREQLELMQLDHRTDCVALEAAAVNYARAIEAELMVEHESPILNEPIFYQGKRLRGVTRQKKHPAVTIATAHGCSSALSRANLV